MTSEQQGLLDAYTTSYGICKEHLKSGDIALAIEPDGSLFAAFWLVRTPPDMIELQLVIFQQGAEPGHLAEYMQALYTLAFLQTHKIKLRLDPEKDAGLITTCVTTGWNIVGRLRSEVFRADAYTDMMLLELIKPEVINHGSNLRTGNERKYSENAPTNRRWYIRIYIKLWRTASKFMGRLIGHACRSIFRSGT